MSQTVGVGAQVTRGIPELLRTGRRELKPWGHVAGPELPQAGRREPELRRHVVAPELPPARRWGSLF
jgi:hypothetical protein